MEPAITVEQTIAALIGRAKSYEYIVEILITTSPNPDVVRAAWNAALPAIVDTHTELQSANWPHYREAFQGGLSRLTGLIDRAAQPS